MLTNNYLQIIWGSVCSFILFIYAIENLSQEIQKLASEKFHKVIGKLVKNRISGTIVGATITALMQSSSAVTVITVILVNTGIISFTSSLGIIFGSNIGTTVTAYLALVSSMTLASILIIIGFVIGLLGPKFKIISKPIFFLGFILFSLSLLSSIVSPLKDDPQVINLFSQLSSPIIAFLAGALFTGIIQSSSVTSGIVVVLTQTGLITPEIGIPMILGANLGSSITALIASFTLNLHARRVGFANLLKKALGSIIFMVFLQPFISLVQSITDGAAAQVALAHLLFNFSNTIVLLIILKPFERLVKTIIKGDEEEILFKTKYINGTEKKSLDDRFKDIEKEINYSFKNSITIFKKAISVFYKPNRLNLMEITKLETLNDFLDDEITEHIVKLSKLDLDYRDTKHAIALIKISNNVEKLADLGEELSKTFLRMHRFGINPTECDIEKITIIDNKLINLFQKVQECILKPDKIKLREIKDLEEELFEMISKDFDSHVCKLQDDENYNGTIFVEAITIIELSISKVQNIRRVLAKQINGYKK